MPGMPAISVIIPTYNREAFVSKAICSALGQSLTDREIIVIDDGSTDGTRAAIEPYRDRIQYRFQENSGVSAARNAGIKAARGEWLAFLDSDDEWTPDYLARQMEKAKECPDICMQTADCLFISARGEEQTYFQINGSAAHFAGQDYLLLREPFRFIVSHAPWQVGSTIVRRRALDKAGLFDTSLTISEDLDLMARVALQGPFGMIREPLVRVYRRQETVQCLTLKAARTPIQARESDERIYQKLAAITGLTFSERRALGAVRSANRRAIGNLLLKEGRRKDAQACYRRALLLHPSFRSLGKFLLGYVPLRLT
jgi:glycosyltransferase involved in cell wall biosynthesis